MQTISLQTISYARRVIVAKPLLKWIGNKQRFAKQIVSYMPESFNNYYEPFLGSGAVLAELISQSYERIIPSFNHAFGSDILPFLIGIFNLVKDTPNELTDYYSEEISKYYLSPETQYDIIRERFNNNPNPYDFCLLSRTCYSGIIRFRKNDGYMSTPRGPHKPISPNEFQNRVTEWSEILQKATFRNEDFQVAMSRAEKNDVVYCDPPYTHSQSIIYGAQNFDINILWEKIAECKAKGIYVLLSINGTRESETKNISTSIPNGLFEREFVINCGTSMIDRLQNSGKHMDNEIVHDKLLLTW